MKSKHVLLIALTAVAAALALRSPLTVRSQPEPRVVDTVASVRIQFGVNDADPADWSGEVSVAGGGELAGLRHWRPRPGDRIEGARFTVTTRKGVPFVFRPWENFPMRPESPYLLTPGVIVDVKSARTARLRVETKHGTFEVSPFALEAGQRERHLGGRVLVDRVPFTETASGERDADFPTLLAHSSGELWSAWVEYQGNGKNAVVARRYDGRAWAAPQTVSGPHTDVHSVKAARDKSGAVWFFWAAQVESNWDIYARRWNGTAWSNIERLSDDAQPDTYPAAVSDSNGNAWVAWQGFRNGKSDIFARRYDGAAWSAAERVSDSPANDWQPALAADKLGRVYVAWDSYDRGNYDVMLRRFAGGQWSAPMAAAATQKFEAYPTLACDDENRLWVAWNEAAYEWGKDTGFLVKIGGTPLYSDRWVNTAVLDGDTWKEPARAFTASLPDGLRDHNDLPALTPDGAGRMWLFFRHRTLRIKNTPPDTPAHRAAWEIYGSAYDGQRWSAPVALPFSAGRQDMRTSFTGSGAPGAIYAAYPSDRRDFEEFLYKKVQVNITHISLPGRAGNAMQLQPRADTMVKAPVVHENESADLARIRAEAWTLNGKTYKIYRGDTHRHTEFSMDGNTDGSLMDAYRYAIDAASLDFLLVSEHNGAGGPDEEYINFTLQQMVDLFTVPGTFVPVYGYERSVVYPNGHRNILFAKRGNPTLPILVDEQKGRAGAAKLYEYLRRTGGIAISHTSASSMGTDWRDNDPEVEPLVEIYQGDRVSNEYEGAPKAAYTGNLASAPGGFRPAGYVWNAWAKGYKLGVQSASDHLSTHISYACTIATELTRQGLIDAMKARHSYGATDNIVLDYRAEAAGKQYLQGETLKSTASPVLVIAAKGTRPIRQIDIIRDNKLIHSRTPMEREVSFRYKDTATVAKESYFYVRVIQVDDQIAWSSPVWVTKP